jgi:hypothetical protein
VLFRGYLPFFSGAAMASFLDSRKVQRHELKSFLLRQGFLLKDHARRMTEREHRPFQYFGERVREEELARRIVERDGIQQGLVCVFSTLEPCRAFSVRWREASYVQSARRKCLFLYYYFMDREFGLIHVRIQTWFPMQIQVYVNGHEWLARKLARHGIRYTKQDNAFLAVEDPGRAQAFADRFTSLNWVQRLDALARAVNPLLPQLLAPMTYYWVTAQAEYATDIVFKSRAGLRELMPRLVEHSTLHFGAKDVMSFLGRKLHGKFEGEVVTDRFDVPLQGRLPGTRVKHRMKPNWLKMYDKAGFVLRIETVINEPEEFRVRRRVRRGRRRVAAWVPLRKSVAYLFRYREISLQSNSRYSNALDKITTRKKASTPRPVEAFNPAARSETQIFAAVMRGEHAVHGFTNRDLRDKLGLSGLCLPDDPKKCSAQVTRMLHRLHVYALIAKIPRSRRWRVTRLGYRVMSAAFHIRTKDFPRFYADAA